MSSSEKLSPAEARKEALRLQAPRRPLGMSGRIAQTFLESKLTPLLVVASLLLGVFALLATPREEEPQIQVPMIDVFAGLPGATAAEIERRVISPLERALYEIENVDYIYSTSQPSGGMIIVRFVVGTDPDEAVVRVHAKLAEANSELPEGAMTPIVAPRGIDDVPAVAYTFFSDTATPEEIRRVATEVETELARHPRVARTWKMGGQRRAVQVRFDRDRLATHHVSILQVYQALSGLNWRLPAGGFASGNVQTTVDVGSYFRDAEEVGSAVVGVYQGRPVYLRQIADIEDGGDEPREYVWMLSGAGNEGESVIDAPAVTVAFSKKPGTNAVVLVEELDARLADLDGPVIPGNVDVQKTRDYGFTAGEKSSELIKHLWIATLAVVLLMALALGRREAVVVLVAVPATLALTLAASYLFGYTLNRVTLFALIFAIGILVDDAIVVVENIHRHYQLAWTSPRQATVYATDEVGNPTILATFTVVAALLPLALVSGLMGPYMRPIPINASAAMVFSLVVAFVVSPWLTYRLFRKHAEELVAEGSEAQPHSETEGEGRFHQLYAHAFRPLIRSSVLRWSLILGVVAVLFLSVSLIFLRVVKVKMLPFDNKSEVQVMIDMPEGSTLEETASVARSLAEKSRQLPEVQDIQVYVGTSAPFNFNGLVRHYFLRSGPEVADLQINLLPKHHRNRDSHDFAKALRDLLVPVAAGTGANVKVTEVPPGPPVLSTMVAEIYGPDLEKRVALAKQVRGIFEDTPGIVDVDWYVEAPGPGLELEIDRAKAIQAGVTPEAIVRTLRVALEGAEAGWLHLDHVREAVPIVLRLDRAQRSGLDGLLSIHLHGAEGRMVPIRELVAVRRTTREKMIYHKNLQPVTYVLAEVAGGDESPVYGILDMQERVEALQDPASGEDLEILFDRLPNQHSSYVMKWDGEWQITYEVFRDMGIAFAAVMVLIYVLVVGWFKSFVTPFIIMSPIPLTLVGVLPAHALGGVFFTATSMIGVIALAGIIVRNSILLVDFINLELAAGETLEDAVIKAGVVRFRPIFLTAAALVVGGLVILLDPIFQGMAVALISGVVVATGLTLVVIPLLYYMYVKAVGVEAVVSAVD